MLQNPTAPYLLLRAEGAAALGISLLLYAEIRQSWVLFAVLFLAPDLSFVAYALGRRVGAVAYNAAHTYVLPAALFGAGFVLERGTLMGLALIWTAHLGADRLLGWGLKYPDAFRRTHLQQVGAGATGEPQAGAPSPVSDAPAGSEP